MSIHEECGVFGIYDPNGGCARTAYYGLYALQHRGQEAAGIATINDRELSYHKDLGLVGDVFDDETLERLNGTMAPSFRRRPSSPVSGSPASNSRRSWTRSGVLSLFKKSFKSAQRPFKSVLSSLYSLLSASASAPTRALMLCFFRCFKMTLPPPVSNRGP